MQSDHSLIVSLAIILVLLVFYRPVATERRNAKRLKQFRSILKDQHFTADLYDFFNNRIAALDYTQSKLIFIEFSPASWKYHQVSVKEIENCRVGINQPDGKLITLDCHLCDQSVIRLPFYDASMDQFSDETSLQQKAEYWQRKICQLKDFKHPQIQSSLSM